MDNAVVDMTGQLRDEIAANDQAPAIDPRTVPARFSTLKQFSQSPAHYLHAVQRGYDETLSMRIGSGAHAVLFGTPFEVWTGKVRNGKAWEAFQDEHDGKLILSVKEHAEAVAIASSVKADRLARQVLFCDGTQYEQRIDWSWQDRAFRSTPDAHSRRHLVDLKCLRSAAPDRVMWQSLKMFYHAQAALYRRALNESGRAIKDCYLVVVENKPPYPVTVLRFTEPTLEQGDKSCTIWMEQLRNCESSGVYPGYCQSIVDLELPGSEMDDLIFADSAEEE